MRDVILASLEELERKENLEVLFAIESGSRAWGFPSPDSDFDVRFVYVRNRDWYLTIFEGRDVVDLPIDRDLDLGGWDLKKALQLASKSNAVLWEWLQSPICYREKDGFITALRTAIEEHFSPRSALHHYLAMADKGLTELQESQEIRLKKYFYIIRPLLAAFWIVEKADVPPMTLKELLSLVESEKMRIAIEELVEQKSRSDESVSIERMAELDNFLIELKSKCEEGVEAVPHRKIGADGLNQFFQRQVSG